ncbi:hypothetical protein TNCV_2488831 [Trichonephila clavipes]|nr:hypothetical protein TNCV_2488831 [Trichonephila clavipes]
MLQLKLPSTPGSHRSKKCSRAALLAIISNNNSITQDILDCHHHLRNLTSLEKTIVLLWVPAHCGVQSNEKADILAENGVFYYAKNFSRPMSFYSINNLIKRSIEARAQEDLYNLCSHKSWKNAILNLRNVSRRRLVAKFRIATGHDCSETYCIDSKLFHLRYALCASQESS